MKSLLSRLRQPPSAGTIVGGRGLIGWLAVTVVTGLVCLITWRLSLVLRAPLILCAAYALPAALALRSLNQAIASFCAITVTGVFLLSGQPNGARLGFVLTGLSIAGAVLYVIVAAGEKLAEARKALGLIRLRSDTSQTAVQRAGVCVVVVGRNHTWLSVNEAAWNAFGSDARLRRGLDARVEMDDEAAASLMHSASREAWRKFHESVVADIARKGMTPGQALPPYNLVLHDISGTKTRYRFTVTLGHRDELVFVGYPESVQDVDFDIALTPNKWFSDVVQGLPEPSVVLQSDGSILAMNRAFERSNGAGHRASYVFDCPNLRGVSERQFMTNVWLPTRVGPQDLPGVRLGDSETAVGARIASPTAAYTEAVVLVFKGEGEDVSDDFATLTKPIGI